VSSANVELARRGFDALRRGDLAAVAAILDEDIKWHGGDPLSENACCNRAEALAWLRRPERVGPGELVEMIDAGERVVAVLRPPAGGGEPAPPLRAAVATFRGGKVVEIRGYDSPAAALSAVGLEPLEPFE
jgi:ketosteroid isomerase-like protein